MYKIYSVTKIFTKTTQPVKPRGPLESHLYPLVGYPFKCPVSNTSSPFNDMDAEKEAYLKSIYYNVSHPASYSGLDRLYREVNYAYKAYIDVLLNFSEDAERSQIQTQLFYKDSARAFDQTKITEIPLNQGLILR